MRMARAVMLALKILFITASSSISAPVLFMQGFPFQAWHLEPTVHYLYTNIHFYTPTVCCLYTKFTPTAH